MPATGLGAVTFRGADVTKWLEKNSGYSLLNGLGIARSPAHSASDEPGPLHTGEKAKAMHVGLDHTLVRHATTPVWLAPQQIPYVQSSGLVNNKRKQGVSKTYV